MKIAIGDKVYFTKECRQKYPDFAAYIRGLRRGLKSGEVLTVTSFDDKGTSLSNESNKPYRRYSFGFKECCGECLINPHHVLYTGEPLESLMRHATKENESHRESQVVKQIQVGVIIEMINSIASLWGKTDDESYQLTFGTITYQTIKRPSGGVLFVLRHSANKTFHQKTYLDELYVDVTEFPQILEYFETTAVPKLQKIKELGKKIKEDYNTLMLGESVNAKPSIP